MTDDSSREISIFLAAIEKEDNNELKSYLDEACGDDRQLRSLVEALVATHRRGGSFLDRPAPGLDQTVNVNRAALEAGLSATFGADVAVVIGDGGHSVLKSLSKKLPNVPRVVLREADEGTEKVVRPNSPELPTASEDNRYQLHGEIARGGMGAVIKARDTDLGRDLAIKVLLDSHKQKPEMLQRFVEEAQIGGQLQHPGIVPVYELGQFGDRRPFFSMKLVKGETLASLLIKRKDPVDDLPKLLGVFEQVCQTMAYAHNKGVIHRDLKPANIMVGAFGEVQVMDWGLAKVLGTGGVEDEKKSLDKHRDISVIQTRRSTGSDSPGELGSQTQMGSVLGTPAYMPPEQALGEVDCLDERADVFGLGAILCEILTGKPPYVGTDGTQVFRQACRGKLEDCFARMDECGAEQELVVLAKHMLAAEPDERLRSAGVVAEELTGYLDGVQQRLKQAELAGAEAQARAEHATRRRKLHIAIAGLMLALAVGATFSAVRFREQRKVQTALATKNVALAKENSKKRQEAELAQQQIAIEKNNVEAQRDRAIKLQQTLRHELYIADMQQVQQAYHEGASDRVDALLKKYVSLEGESDLRGWEWYYWWRACHLHAQQFQDPEPFTSMAVSPDRAWLAVRGWPQDVHILDSRTLKEITLFSAGSFRHHFGWTEFAISSDGRLFACISNESIKLFRTGDWSELPSLQHDRALQAIVFSSSGLLAAADSQGRVTFWDVERNAKQGSPLETGHSLSCLAFSPDGHRLATGHLSAGNNKTPSLLVWDVATRKLHKQLVDKVHDVTALAWNAKGDLSLIAAGFAEGNVRLWEGTTYSERDWLVAGGSVLTLAFSPNGEQLAAGTARNNAVVWDMNAARRISVMKGHFRPVSGVGFAEDNQTIWSSSQDGYVKSWNVSKSAPYSRLSAAFALSGGYLTFGADGQSLWLLQGAGDIHCWNSGTGDSLPALSVEEPVKQIAFSNNGRFLAVFKPEGEARNRLQVWRTEVADPIVLSNAVLREDPLAEAPAAIAISDDGSVVAWSRGRDLALLDLSSGEQTSGVLEHEPMRLALSPDGEHIVEHYGWSARLWNLAQGTPANHLNLSGFPVSDVRFSPDGRYLAQALLNNVIQLHNAATGEVLHHFRGHAGGVRAIDFSPDGVLLASGGVDGTVRLWDVEHRSLLVTLSSHDQPIASVAFSPDGQTIASISDDGDMRLWRGGTEPGMQDVRYWVWQAEVYRERESWESELDQWAQAIRLAPEDASLYLARAEVRIRLEQFPGAVADYQRAFQHAELADREQLLAVGSKLGSRLEFDPNESFIAILSRALEADEGNELLLQRRADLYAAFERWDEAAADYLAILQIRSKAANWTTGPGWNTQRSKILLELTRLEALFDALLRQLPDANDLWLARGRSLALCSEWSASLEAFGQYTKGVAGESSIESEIWFEIACLNQILDDDQGYRRCLTRFRDQAGENPNQFDAFVLARTAGLSRQAPELAQQAVHWGELSLTHDPRPWKVHALGLALYRAGEHEAAMEKLQESLASNWAKTQNQLALALVCHATGGQSQAEKLVGDAHRWRDEQVQLAVDGLVNVQVIDWLAIHALLRDAEGQLTRNDD